MELWPFAKIYAALGKEAAKVLPELLRPVELTVRIPLFQVKQLETKEVRNNLMGYWYSTQWGQTYSKMQVARMKHAVDTFRSHVIDRTVFVTVTVNAHGLDVTESLFTKPPLLNLEAERIRILIRKPARRTIDAAVRRFRSNRPAADFGNCMVRM